MPDKIVAIGALAALLSVLSHPHRLRIVEELGVRALDVGELQGILQTSHSVVSRHLARLRAHHVVAERRIGRHIQYRLVRPSMAKWLLRGLSFVAPSESERLALLSSVDEARKQWGAERTERASRNLKRKSSRRTG